MFDTRSRISPKAAPSPDWPPPTIATSWTWPSGWLRGRVQPSPPKARRFRSVATSASSAARPCLSLMTRPPAHVPHAHLLPAHVLQAQADDLADLGERGLDLGLAVVAEPARHRGEDAGLVGPAHADDEGEAEALAIGGVQRVESLVLRRRQPVEPGRGLLGRRGLGQRAVDRRLAGELRMGADQHQLLLRRERLDHRHQAPVQVVEGPAAGGALDDPRRVLEELAVAGDEGLATDFVDVVATLRRGRSARGGGGIHVQGRHVRVLVAATFASMRRRWALGGILA